VQQPREGIDDTIQLALKGRRDLQVAQLTLDIAEESKRDAWYRFLPSLVFTGMYRYADVKGFSDRYDSWNIGLALSVPLYDGGLRYAYLRESDSLIREATLQLQEKERQIKSEIRQLWLNMETAEANLVKARRSVELAKRQVELAKASYEAGTITNLEVLDANYMLFISEVSEAQEELNRNLAILRLQKSVRMFSPLGTMTSAPSMSGTASSAGAESSGSMGEESGAMSQQAGSSGMGF
jgi:outer membrane protein TolC